MGYLSNTFKRILGYFRLKRKSIPKQKTVIERMQEQEQFRAELMESLEKLPDWTLSMLAEKYYYK